ncbi:emp24/gp25L/p24 family/GOLD-domain-containing protein [Obelidium mucronatum]|nr:emp24/gp25L/p24 family/GOLD-domain-containing protein [Obelidium mucronatum]
MKIIFLATTCTAVTLSFHMKAHEAPCFYSTAREAGEKINFYFAVQEGGKNDIDYVVTSPDDKVFLSGEQENTIDILFSAKYAGDYKFCFSNDRSSFHDKKVDFDITVASEVEDQKTGDAAESIFPTKKSKEKDIWETVKPIETSLQKMRQAFVWIARDLRALRTQENRAFQAMRQTESQLLYFNIAQNCLIFGVAGVQVFALQSLFGRKRKSII